MQKLIFLLCRILAALPLKSLHAMAGFWGGLAFYLLHKDRARIRENLQIAGLPADDAAVKKVLRETAKGALELPVAFFRRPEDLINHSAYFVDGDTRGIEYVVGWFVQKILQGVLI